MTLSNLEKDIMPGRNGGTLRLIGAAFCIIVIVYLVYNNQNMNTKLHETESLVERYKRSQSSLSVQLKDLLAVKTDQETRHQNDKDAMLGKFNALTRDFKMLQDKKEELGRQYQQLTQECSKENEENKAALQQRDDEHEAYKRTQAASLSNLQETIDNLQKEKDKYIADLQTCKQSIEQLKIDKQTAGHSLQSVHAELNKLHAERLAYQEQNQQRAAEVAKKSGVVENVKTTAPDQNKVVPQPGNDQINPREDVNKPSDPQPVIKSGVDQGVEQHRGPTGAVKMQDEEVQNMMKALDHIVPGQDSNLHFKTNHGVIENPQNNQFQARQIKPPEPNDLNQGYKKQRKLEPDNVGHVPLQAKEQFDKEQQENAQLQKPKVLKNSAEGELERDRDGERDDGVPFKGRNDKPLQPRDEQNEEIEDEDDNKDRDQENDEPVVMPNAPINQKA